MKHDLDYYRAIQGMEGAASAKEAEIRAIKFEVLRDFGNSLDCEDVTINGESSSLLITKTNDRTIKNIAAKPDETVHYGDIVRWLSDDWIVDVIDSDDRINIHGKMRRCNIVLRWVDASGIIHAYPGICEDATKYSEGVVNGKIAQTADFQIKVKIHLDANSAKIARNMRFLLDASLYLSEMESVGEHASAYIVTRRNVLTGNHRGRGYVELTLVECAYSDSDNPQLMIADYYKKDDTYLVSIENTPSPLSLPVGAEYTLAATVTKNGVPDQTAIWFYTSDPSVATVNDEGVITSVGEGSCVVTAQVADSKHTLRVHVVESASQFEIRIEPDDGRFDVVYGDTKEIRYRVYSNMTPMPYALSASILDGEGLAQIEDASDNSALLVAENNKDNVGKTFTLKVHEDGYDISAEATFEIVGWW